MARYREKGRDTTPTYQAAEEFRNGCLLADGSLLFDSPLWTAENLNLILKSYVEAPDESDRPFMEKFRDQIKDAGQRVVRLAAEVLAIYFLFPSNVTARRKLGRVEEVLGWSGDVIPKDHLVRQAFAAGIGSGGQGYSTRRPDELTFLIHFAIALKQQSREAARQKLQDPWQFMEFLDGIEDADGRQLRHMLLHLLFPDHFERIATRQHKRQADLAFSGLVTNPPENLDRRLFAIRQELGKLLPGQQLDFYLPPLREAWNDSGGDIEIIHHKKQVVLYGPPGTSKTHRALRLAERIIRSAALRSWGGTRYFQQQTQIKQAVTNNVHVVQLHPAFSYEDFVRGLHLSGSKTEYRPGVLLQVLARMQAEPAGGRLPHILILDEMNRTDLSRMLGECFSLLENRERPVRLPGTDANGQDMTLALPADLYVVGTMNLIDQSVEQIDFALRRRFFWIECRFDPDALLEVVQELWAKDPTPRHEWDRVEGDFSLLASAASALNHAIHESDLLGPQYEIGHTYFFDAVHFLKQDLADASRGRRNFLWQNGRPRQAVEQLWDLSLKPLLGEYLAALRGREREDKLRKLRNMFFSPPEVEE